ncbi:MAG TPA: hypothetical protein VFS20_09045 [Longimicrobium sp.]|nr:hypothetical protein [Longimicrobium sp.]
MRHTIVTCAILFTAPAALAQSPARDPRLPVILPEERQMALARSAGPAHVAEGAALYVLRPGGYVRVRGSSNGHSCLVEHDHPESIAPVCYDAEATRSILPGVLRIAELRETGLSYTEAKERVDELYRTGRLPAPRRAAMSYMLSRDQVLFASPTGERVGAWRPHVMIFSPFATADQVGAKEGIDPVPFVADAGKATAHIVIVVPEWSTPGAAGASAGSAGEHEHGSGAR